MRRFPSVRKQRRDGMEVAGDLACHQPELRLVAEHEGVSSILSTTIQSIKGDAAGNSETRCSAKDALAQYDGNLCKNATYS